MTRRFVSSVTGASSLVLAAMLLVATGGIARAETNILLISSSYHKGGAPVPHLIQPPLENAGFAVTLWEQATEGWPPLDTLLSHDAVFFHGGERRMTGPIDSILTEYAALGGRLVAEGANLSSYGSVYHEFKRRIVKSRWLREDVESLGCTVTDTGHPITAGIPETFSLGAHASSAWPDHSLSAYGGETVIGFSAYPNSMAVGCSPRRVYINHALARLLTTSIRDSLIVNCVRWVLSDPEDDSVENLTYELGHDPGETIPVDLEIANWSAEAHTGRVVLEASTDSVVWLPVDSVDYVLPLRSSAQYGLQWTPLIESRYHLRAVLSPDCTDTESLNNELATTVSTLQSAVHPHMFFTADEIPDLQLRAQTTHSGFANALEQEVNSTLSWEPLPVEEWYRVPFSSFAVYVSRAALQAVLVPTPTYVDHAKRLLLALCRYPHWQTGFVNQDIYAGRCCRAVAYAFDWLYHDLSRPERDTVQVKLKRQLELLNAADAQFIWWTDAYMHNHHWVGMSQLGAACYALWEEEPYGAMEWEQTARTSLDRRFSLCGSVTDGSWYEAMNYWGLISWGFLPHVYLLREQRGIDYFDTPFIQGLAKYRVYGALPHYDEMPMLNEAQTGEWYGPDPQLALIASEYGDEQAQWMRKRVIERAGYAVEGPTDFFFYDPSVPETPPTDLSFIAIDQDSYFGRSSWETTATYVSLKCGMPTGRTAYENFWAPGGRVGDFAHSHFHPDQNQLTMFFRGKYIASGPGLTHPRDYTRTSGTILINNRGQYGDSINGNWPPTADIERMNPHLADTLQMQRVDYVIGDATTSYPAHLGLTMFHRHLLFIRPDLVVVLDRLKSEDPSTFTFILRHPSEIWTWDDSKVTMTDSPVTLDMHVLSPDQWTVYTEFEWLYRFDWGGWGFFMDNAVPDTSLRFFNVFYPPDDDPPELELLACTDSISAMRLTDSTHFQALVMLRYEDLDSTFIEMDSLCTDAQMAVVLHDSAHSAFAGVTVKRCSFLQWGTTHLSLLASDSTVDLEWWTSADTLKVYGSYHEWVTLWDSTSTVVWFNGQSVPFGRDGDFVTIGAPIVDWPVTNLTIRRDDDTTRLNWTPVPGDTAANPVSPLAYKVYRAVGWDAEFELLATIPGNPPTYADPLHPAEEYVISYYVTARAPAYFSPGLRAVASRRAAQPAAKVVHRPPDRKR